MVWRVLLRRFALGLGAVLLVVGWGTTRYADAQQAAVASGKSEPITAWVGERTKSSTFARSDEFISGRTLYMAGIGAMALGAAFVIYTYPRH